LRLAEVEELSSKELFVKFDPNRKNENNPKTSATRSPQTFRPPVALLFRVRFFAPSETERPDEVLSLSASAETPKKRKAPRKLASRQPRSGAGGPRRREKFSSKRLGEIAEAMFLAKAADLGFTVLRPWGESEAYDFVLDAHHGNRGLSRVQVKSSHRVHLGTGYQLSAHGTSMHAYTQRHVDAIVAVIVPENAWYVIPIQDLRNVSGLHLFPSSKSCSSKYEAYGDAWWHLDTEKPRD
jgi:hypothetical protein